MSSPKPVSVLILLFVTVALSSASPNLSSSIKVPSCPCYCFVGHDIDNAAYQCQEPRYRHICAVTSCKKFHKVGKSCCDHIPPTPSATASYSPTPSPKIIPCPCICRRKGYYAAEKECKQPYISPKCKVLSCGHHGKYECCDHKPTPSPTPTESPKPKCPCYCTNLHEAVNQCRPLSHCSWSECRSGKFSCCDKH